MKALTFISFSLGLVVSAVGQSKPSVADLDWISGCWLIPGEDATSFVTERWSKPYGMMIGTNRTVDDSKVTAYEFLRIEERDGDVYYVAKHSAEAEETPFKLAELDERKAVFENPNRDFPTRIIYSVSVDMALTVRVESDEKGFSQTFRSISCADY